MLPSAATWWCGQSVEICAYVLEHLDDLVVKPAFPTKGQEPVFGRRLSEREKSELAATIRDRPEDFVAQAHVSLSTRAGVASSASRAAVDRPQDLRRSGRRHIHGDARRPDARRRAASDVPIVSMQRGGSSKDTWVLADGPVSPVTAADAARSDPAWNPPRPSCRAAWPRISSGSAATSNAPNTSSGCCAAS